MADPKELRRVARGAADLLLAYPWKLWFWGDSIGLEGLLDASELTGDCRYLGFVYGLLKGWLAREKCRSQFDYTAAGVALLRVYERTQDPALLDAAIRHADYLAAFRRTEAGAYVRYENAAIELPPVLPPDHPEFGSSPQIGDWPADGGPCIFVDSVHFEGPFFSKLYQVTREERYRQLALESLLAQIELLYDPEDHLFHHFWMERTRTRNNVIWGRGNGWGLLGLVETLQHLSKDDPATGRIREVLNDVLRQAKRLGDECGGWHTVLDDPSSYIETSISAFIVDVASRSVRHGWVDGNDYCPVIESGMAFLLRNVREDGLLEGVSYETFPSTRVEHYRQMPRGAMVPWGQGPLLAALWSYDQLRSRQQRGIVRQ